MEFTMPKKSKSKPRYLDKHYLYSAAVQSVGADIKFFKRVYKKKNQRPLKKLREDFCGTAALACDWVRRDESHQAWGVDLDRATLDWGLEHYAAKLGDRSERLHLICDDVRQTATPKADLVAAQNFSYSVFKTRQELRGYFESVRQSIADDGVFVLDTWGGTEVMQEDSEKRKIVAEKALDGTKIPSFTYIWEQASFNPVDHRIVCHIGFKLRDGTRMRRAFTYDWRLWMLPELRELLSEAGFVASEVFIEGWDDEADDTDGIFRKRKRFENQEGWVAYLVAYAGK